MRKWIAGLLLGCILVIFAGCGANTSDENEGGATQSAVYLEMEKSEFPLQAEEISYTVVNQSGEDVYVTLIPCLERETDGGWEKLETVGVGFCGTPDRVAAQRTGAIPLSWYEGCLTDGHYRLSFVVVEFENYEPIATISDTFRLSETGIEKSEP